MTNLNDVATNAKNKREAPVEVREVQCNVQFSEMAEVIYVKKWAIDLGDWVVVSRLRKDGYCGGCMKYAVFTIHKEDWGSDEKNYQLVGWLGSD
jgi:hypothetical protein